MNYFQLELFSILRKIKNIFKNDIVIFYYKNNFKLYF